ncbi:HAMP domain-containing histidine kinase [Gluconacetobacter entanii]|uniref:histidine kinase n=1 Tax=Gluconacetobacter entanii TaxID=108528 RepID=A0ABT3K4Z8_9PROT|nr:ATP-binding protein [Gluconacetobacter entanii]MCW4590469.1 HAMP domain-containing histidine kinase [Gluconacetobacter entanii]MCW4593654.1 HAMP domain-containing histidine kinase [Gluconacetobacter entanii]NPC89734.1 histidine kinase [Gluconacetobacter entanii]
MHDLLAGVALGGGGYALTRAVVSRAVRWYRGREDDVPPDMTPRDMEEDAQAAIVTDRPAGRLLRRDDPARVDPLATLPHMLDLLPGACIVFGPRGDLAHASTSARDMFGDTLGAIVRHPATQQVLEQLSTTAETTVTLDVPVRRVVRVLLRRIAPSVPGARGVVVALLEDRTGQDALDRMRGDFVAHASHELRTPLAALSGFIETLRGPAANDAPARARFLGIMAGQAERMLRLLDRLSYLSRVQMVEHQRPRTRIDIAPVVARAMDEARPLLEGADITCALDVAPGIGPVMADADQIVQVMLNLVGNAIRYAPGVAGRRARVDVTVANAPGRDGGAHAPWPCGGGVVVCVRDNGPGIPARYLPRVTEQFYRVPGQVQQGTGLGLAIVKHIVDRHGGRLQIESREGEGTACTLWLPPAEDGARDRRGGAVAAA